MRYTVQLIFTTILRNYRSSALYAASYGCCKHLSSKPVVLVLLLCVIRHAQRSYSLPYLHRRILELRLSFPDGSQDSDHTANATAYYSIITAKVRRDLLESQKKYTTNKYCKYNEIKQCSKCKHILRRGVERDIVVFLSMSEQV